MATFRLRPNGRPIQDLTGKKFNRLTVIGLARPIKQASNGTFFWSCRCDCGNNVDVRAGHITAEKGATTSCGCALIEWLKENKTTHGNSKPGKRTGAYISWIGMRARCLNPNDDHYDGYGARGITVCDRWRDSFENFLLDMGDRPPIKTLDRIDVNGNYEPSNCRWATPREQANNKRNSAHLTIGGVTKTILEWENESPIENSSIRKRLEKGWTAHDAVFTPRTVRSNSGRRVMWSKDNATDMPAHQ